MIEKKRGRGRPVGKDGGKDRRIIIRATDDASQRITDLAKLTGKSKTSVLLEAFDIYENLKRTQLSTSDMEEIDDIYDYYDGYDDEYDEMDDF